MNNIDESINRNLASIESKLDAMLADLKARHPVDSQLTDRLDDADTRFTAALAMLTTIQGQFIGKGGAVIYYSIEGVRNEIKAAYQVLAAGTKYDGNLDSY